MQQHCWTNSVVVYTIYMLFWFSCRIQEGEEAVTWIETIVDSCITFIIMMMIDGWSWSIWWWWHELKQLLSVPLCQLLLSSKCTCSSCSWSLILVSVVSLISVFKIGSFLSLSKLLLVWIVLLCRINQRVNTKSDTFCFHFGNPLSSYSSHWRIFEVELHIIRKWKVFPWSIWHTSM